MLKDFFESVKQFCTDQSRVVPQLLGFKGDHRKLLYWNPALKEVEEIDVSPPDNKHKLHTVANVVQYIKHVAGTHKPIVWVGNEAVTIEVDESVHRNVLTMPLVKTPRFALLEKLNGTPSVPQDVAIRLLRQDFAGFDIGSKALTGARNMRTQKVEDMHSEQSHVASRVGKSIQQDAVGGQLLPEYLEITTSVYVGNSADDKIIQLWLSYDHNKPGNLRFEPDATAMMEAVEWERSEIAAELRRDLDGTDVKVFEGEYFVAN